MTTLDQIRQQLTVIPCRFGEKGDLSPIPNSVLPNDGDTNSLSLMYGFPSKTAVGTDSGGLYILRDDVNSAGCMASDEAFFRQCGGFHTFDADTIFINGDATYVSSIFVTINGRSSEFVRTEAYDARGIQTYYAWTNDDTVLYTTMTEPALGTTLYEVSSASLFSVAEGVYIDEFVPSSDGVNAAIVVSGTNCPRKQEADETLGSVTYCGWEGGWYTQTDTPYSGAGGTPLYTKSDGLSVSPLPFTVADVTVSSAGGGYPEDAVLEYEVFPFLLKVMSRVGDNRVDFTKDETELQTERNWKIVEPEKAYDIENAVCQVDWSTTRASSTDRFYSFYSGTVAAKPFGFFAKAKGPVVTGGSTAGVIIAVKDANEAKGF